MPSVLFLCHRLPWPPDKGDKIRSYHVLQWLATRYRVYLGTFVDDPADWRYRDAVEAVCADTCIRPLRPWLTRWRALTSLARGEALTPGCYHDRTLQRWVERVLTEHRPDLTLCYSSGVAPLVLRHHELRRIMDFVDTDSDKWRQYAQTRRGLARAVYAREARKLSAFEHRVAAEFDASLFVSEAEAEFFRRQVPSLADKIRGIANGVDTTYWNPQGSYPDPYQSDERVVVFVGAMDYRANVHAATWFAHEVWPRIRAKQPRACFYIVGTRPTKSVRLLERLDGVVVTGQVDDVRPYLKHAHAVAAPLRIARGIQNKVLEALAMGKPILATPEAWEGIVGFGNPCGCVSDSPEVMAAVAARCLETAEPLRIPEDRATVIAQYGWEHKLAAYADVLRGAGQSGAMTSTLDAMEIEAGP